MRFLIAATIATLAIGTTAVNAQIESEIEVLKSIATSTGGWENVKSKPWLVSTASTACSSIDGWDGIKCEKIAEQDRVVEISFPFRKNINGTIANIELNKLPYLRKIYISETEISGALPNFSSHPTLEEIEITLNPKLTSPITALPSQLYRIQIWNNGWNQGALPSLDSVNGTTLRWFNFESSQVTGTIPSFEKFINLESVSLTGNKITGGIPRFNPPLRELFLGRNELTVFDVANLPVTLRQFSINTNKIVAPFPNLGKLTDAYNIDLSNNGFYGQVPLASIPAPSRGSNQTYQNDYYTYRLDISKNSLTGAVPPLTNSWLQSRATPAGVIHKIWWYTDCNLFQTGLPELAAMFSECYDNKDTARCAQICPPKLPGSSTITTPTPNTNTNTNTTTSPPTKPAGPKNDAAATTTTAASVFTGVFALCAAFAARF